LSFTSSICYIWFIRVSFYSHWCV